MIQNITGKICHAGISAVIPRVTIKWLQTSAFSTVVKNTIHGTMKDDVLLKDVEDCGVIVLNRPKALNSLSLSMIQKIHPVFKQWESSKRLVMIEGAGDKAFCAGGDIKSLIPILNVPNEEALAHDLAKREYTLIHHISIYKKPYIAFIDGITMGGGAGLSVHGKYSVATEKTLFAMPETAIGLFPDAGVDVLLAGIATHYVPQEKLADLKHDLLTSPNSNVDDILNKYQPKLNHEFSLAPHMSQIEHCFSAPTVEEIIKRLREDNSEWAQKNVEILLKMCPSSLKISKKAIDEGKGKSLAECLKIEYRLTCAAVTKDSDFYEGVRALLIDKDQKPMWKPSTLADVTDEYINKRFAPLRVELELCASRP